METTAVIHNLEAALEAQLSLAGPEGEAAGRALLGALRPALREAALELAEQAAEEVRAQLPGHRVDLTIVEGEPTLRVAGEEPAVGQTDEDFAARITLRLPPSVKELIENTASDSGDSVNTWIVKTLAGRAGSRRPGGQRIAQTFEL
jgi:hypothetical protein